MRPILRLVYTESSDSSPCSHELGATIQRNACGSGMGHFSSSFSLSVSRPLRAAAPSRIDPRASTINSPPQTEWFADRAEASGLDFVHFNGMSGQVLLPRDHGAGRRAVRLRQRRRSRRLPRAGPDAGQHASGGGAAAAAGTAPAPGTVVPERSRGQAGRHAHAGFTDVTEASGIKARGYGMGVAAGDFNNDGCVDLYLTNLGPNQLFRNNCDGTFTDVSKASRVDDSGWSVLGRVLRLRSRRLARSVRRPLPRLQRRGEHALLQSSGNLDYCPPHVYRPAAEPSVSQQPRRHVHRRHRRGGHGARVRAGARRGDGGLQRRRLDRSLRRQRRPAEPAVDQPARRHVQEHGAPRRRRR